MDESSEEREYWKNWLLMGLEKEIESNYTLSPEEIVDVLNRLMNSYKIKR